MGRTIVRVLWAAGLLISAYLTFEHATQGATLVCADTGVINCASVTSSSYAFLLGIPVAVLGLLYFVAGTAYAFLLAPRLPDARARALGAAFTGLGVAFVLYLIWAEIQLGQLCTWCTAVHVITAALFVYYLSTWAARWGTDEVADVRSATTSSRP